MLRETGAGTCHLGWQRRGLTSGVAIRQYLNVFNSGPGWRAAGDVTGGGRVLVVPWGSRAWWLALLWVVLGAGGAGYALVCDLVGCTSAQRTSDEFWFPLFDGEPGVVAGAGVIAALVWLLVAVPLLVAGLVRVRGGRGRGRAAAWAGAWAAGLVLMVAVVVVGGVGVDFPAAGWGELLVLAAWVVLGVVTARVLAGPAGGGRGAA